MSVKWILVGLLFGSIAMASTTAAAGCCCGRQSYWRYYPGEWMWIHGRPYSPYSGRQSHARYHYPTWKFDRAAGEWRRLSQ